MADSKFYNQMLSDLPSQFKHKARIEGLTRALAKQLDEIFEVLAALNDQRYLLTAIGQQLDGIGSIVVLTREEATKFALKSSAFTSMTDDIYRLYLIHKMLANMTNCTYKDIYNALTILWGKTPIWYSESIDEPAAFTMTVPALSSFDERSTYLGVWEIRPAGVQVHFTATASAGICINADFRPSAFIITHIKTGTKPRWAKILAFEGVIVDEALSPIHFIETHEMTSENLHSGTNPIRILFLDVDGVIIKAILNKDFFLNEYDRAGTKPHEAIKIGIEDIDIIEALSKQTFIETHEQTSESLHTGTNPSRIMYLGADGVSITEKLSSERYLQEFDRAGTKPDNVYVVDVDNIKVEASGDTDAFIIDHEATSETLHAGTEPSAPLILDAMTANVFEILDKGVYDVEFARSGTEPQPAVPNQNDAAGVAAKVNPASFSVKYRKCGTGRTKS